VPNASPLAFDDTVGYVQSMIADILRNSFLVTLVPEALKPALTHCSLIFSQTVRSRYNQTTLLSRITNATVSYFGIRRYRTAARGRYAPSRYSRRTTTAQRGDGAFNCGRLPLPTSFLHAAAERRTNQCKIHISRDQIPGQTVLQVLLPVVPRGKPVGSFSLLPWDTMERC